jgi:hypothetical protein
LAIERELSRSFACGSDSSGSLIISASQILK